MKAQNNKEHNIKTNPTIYSDRQEITTHAFGTIFLRHMCLNLHDLYQHSTMSN